jgi:hypothetical protein
MEHENLNKKETANSDLGAVSSSIFCAIGRTNRYRNIYSNSNWFADCEYYVITEKPDCLIIRKCGLEFGENAVKVNKKKTGGFDFQIVSELPIGKFEFDKEESNEDVAKIYYR